MSEDLQIFDDDDMPAAAESESGFAATEAEAPRGLMEILPADFPLPALIKFVPDPKIKAALDAAVEKALKVKVENGGEAALREADASIAELADALNACDLEFESAAQAAYNMHRHITGTRSTWKAQAETLKTLIGKQMFRERKRLDDLAAEARRQEQERANAAERQRIADAAAKARQAGAPPKAVAKIEEKAATAQAAPVPIAAPVKLAASSIVSRFRGRLRGTLADAEPHPSITDLTEEQWEQGLKPLLAYILANAPGTFRAALSINWSAIDDRAHTDKKSFSIPGLEPFEDGSAKAKGRR